MRSGLRTSMILLILLSAGCSRTPPQPASKPRLPEQVPASSTNNQDFRPAAGGASPGAKSSAAQPPPQTGSAQIATSIPANGAYRCLRADDGNTLQLEKVGTVVLVGLKAPASSDPGGTLVVQQMRQAVEGRSIRVEFCSANPKNAAGHYRVVIGYRDQSGQDHNLNQLMIRQGLARLNANENCHVAPPLSSWQQYQDYAQQNRKGLWKTVWANQAGESRTSTGSPLLPSSPTGGRSGAVAPRSQPPLGSSGKTTAPGNRYPVQPQVPPGPNPPQPSHPPLTGSKPALTLPIRGSFAPAAFH